MKGFFCFMLSALLIIITGCSDGSDNADGEHSQNAHLFSVNVRVIEAVEDSDKLFKVEALETCGKRIKQGDAILVTADSSDISSVLASYQENNSFRIYFPTVNDTSDRISVTCFDIVQYDSAGKIVNQDAPKDASPEPEQTPSPEATAAPTAEPENIFDRIPTEGNVWKINEVKHMSFASTGTDVVRIFHQITREYILEYFGMELDLSGILPDNMYERPDTKYGFVEYLYNKRVVKGYSFFYQSGEDWASLPNIMITFNEGGLSRISHMRQFDDDFREQEPESSVIQGQDVIIVQAKFANRFEPGTYVYFYYAEFANGDLGVTIEAEQMELEDVKKVIEYLVYYALKREGAESKTSESSG